MSKFNLQLEDVGEWTNARKHDVLNFQCKSIEECLERVNDYGIIECISINNEVIDEDELHKWIRILAEAELTDCPRCDAPINREAKGVCIPCDEELNGA